MIEFEETTYTGEFRIDEAPLGFSLKAKIAEHADTTFAVTGGCMLLLSCLISLCNKYLKFRSQ